MKKITSDYREYYIRHYGYQININDSFKSDKYYILIYKESNQNLVKGGLYNTHISTLRKHKEPIEMKRLVHSYLNEAWDGFQDHISQQ